MNVMITPVGYAILKDRRIKLSDERKQIIEDMNTAKENCLSSDDNSELNYYYQLFQTSENQISALEDVFAKIKVVDVDNIPTDKVRFGSLVTLLDYDTDQEIVYRVVSIHESDPKSGLLSIESPLGKSMVGSRVGDTIDLTLPTHTKEYEIVKIESKAL